MVVKKITAFFLAIALCFGAFCAFPAYAAEKTEAELSGVSIVYAPITSKVVYAQIGPNISGMVLELSFSDATTEKVTVTYDGEGYMAGEYDVSADMFFLTSVGNADNYGMKTISVLVHDGEASFGDSYDILSIPSPMEFVCCILNLLKIHAF